jgi:hypothetical protein
MVRLASQRSCIQFDMNERNSTHFSVTPVLDRVRLLGLRRRPARDVRPRTGAHAGGWNPGTVRRNFLQPALWPRHYGVTEPSACSSLRTSSMVRRFAPASICSNAKCSLHTMTCCVLLQPLTRQIAPSSPCRDCRLYSRLHWRHHPPLRNQSVGGKSASAFDSPQRPHSFMSPVYHIADER